MMKTFTSIAIVFGALAYSTAHAASFDCSKARSSAEKIICADAELSNEDEQYAKLVKSVRAVISDKASFNRALIAAWKTREQTCTTRECVYEWYKTQVDWIEHMAKDRKHVVDEEVDTKVWYQITPEHTICPTINEAMENVDLPSNFPNMTPEDVASMWRAAGKSAVVDKTSTPRLTIVHLENRELSYTTDRSECEKITAELRQTTEKSSTVAPTSQRWQIYMPNEGRCFPMADVLRVYWGIEVPPSADTPHAFEQLNDKYTRTNVEILDGGERALIRMSVQGNTNIIAAIRGSELCEKYATILNMAR